MHGARVKQLDDRLESFDEGPVCNSAAPVLKGDLP